MIIKNELIKYENWNNLKSELLDILTNKEKGNIFEFITKYYLIINPIYKTKFKEVWLLNEVPIKIKEYLNLPNNDEGIDLIAQTKDDEYWAIQCKYRTDEDSSITREDIATFLDISNNICKNISQKLVCTTANRQSYKFDKLYDDSITFLLANTWNCLDKNFFLQLNALLKNKLITFNPFKPKEHQIRAIENAYIHFEEEKNSRGKLIMACGSGKSLTAYWIAEKLQSKTILIAVPSLALIKQTLEVWTRESVANGIDINWIAVCSDDSVSKIDDLFTATTKDLGIDVSTNIDYISNWLQNTNHDTTIVFTTYHSSKVIAEASKKANITYDFGIMDEAHRTVGLKGSLYSHLLFDKNIPIIKRLFMTATERRYKRSSDEIASMDDIKLYGEDFEVLTFKEALESEPPILCDYKIIAMMVTKKEIAELIENNNFVKPQNENYTKEIESEMLASTVALHKAIKKYDIKHTISFHSTIERAKFFQIQEKVFRQSFNEYTDLDTFHVSGGTPTATRNKVIETFSKAENSLITNARCLTEGVDVPNIDCILFADPRQSTVDIVQAVGRALRLAKDKEFGYVLVPILIDDENIDIENIKNKSFQALITILRALASNDERIIDYFQTTDSARLTNGGRLINFDIPIGFNIDIKEFNDAIKLFIISKIKKLKWRPFEEAREFARSLGLKYFKEWKQYCKGELADKPIKPTDIPPNPSNIYRITGWNGSNDWLGILSNGEKYLPFKEAREFARSLGLERGGDWHLYCNGHYKDKIKKPDNIPRTPSSVYFEFDTYTDWIGVKKEFLSYTEASKYIQKLNINTKTKWREWKKENRPENLPANPDTYYSKYKNEKEWISWQHFFGTEKYSFEKSKEFARSLNLRSSIEWSCYCKGEMLNLTVLSKNIPRDPRKYYKNEWTNWEDWLGNSKYLPYLEARKFAVSLDLSGQTAWRKYCKNELNGFEPKPVNIPSAPHTTYENKGWVDIADWLGTNRKRRNKSNNDNTWLSYEQARDFVHQLNLTNENDWKKYTDSEFEYLDKKPTNIPKTPSYVYENNGWTGFKDWLGTAR